MRVFLSYAEEDRDTASLITYWLDKNTIEVYNWLDPEQRGGQFTKQIQDEILNADAFLVLLSPSFLLSSWCQREVDLAIRQEQALQEDDPSAIFIRVLEIRGTPKQGVGFLGGYDWLDFTVWCEGQGLQTLPAAPATLCLYLSALAEAGRKASTIKTSFWQGRYTEAAELAREGMRYPVRWACHQKLNEDGSLTLRPNLRQPV